MKQSVNNINKLNKKGFKESQSKKKKANGKKQQNKSNNARLQENIQNKVNNTKRSLKNNPTPPAFSEYIRMLLYHDQPITTSPLEPRKMFYKTVKYQDLIEVNASGDLFAGGSIPMLAKFANTSGSSPILYATTGYNPLGTSTVTGGWNSNIIGTQGTNVSLNEVSSQYVMGAHIKVSLTGVSNLNKQGQVHIFEDVDDTPRYGISADTVTNNGLLAEYKIGDLPKCTYYKRVDILNMDSRSVLEYNYIPMENLRQDWGSKITLYNSNGTLTEPTNKNFGFIVTSAAPGTTLRIEYEIKLAQEIKNDYINNYPPIYSRIYVDANPTLQFLQQNVDNIIRTEKHDNYYNLIKDVKKHDHGGYTHISGVELYTSWNIDTVESSREYHIPFHNFAGPGTHVLERLRNRKKPINYLDEAALIHDIDYMNPYITKDQADYNMVENLAKQGSLATALITKLMLKMFNSFGKKESDLLKYLVAKEEAEALGYINPVMGFTPYTHL